MNITEETERLTGNPLLRYAILAIGLLILLLSQGALTWKRTAERDATGNVKSIELSMIKLAKAAADSEDADEKKELREQIKDIRENKLEDAQLEATSESVDALNGTWFWSLVHLAGIACISLGLLVIATTGSNHEKLGALVAFGMIVARL